MDNQVFDMSNTYIEHSIIISNFVSRVGSQMKDSLCRVFPDNVQYQWQENDNKIVIPDASINCDIRNRKSVSFTGVPRFVMEVLSDSTEADDRGRKLELYAKVGVSEYWIVDWRKRQVEIYLFDGREDGSLYPYLYKTVNKENSKDLQIVIFPHISLAFEELFDLPEL